MSTDVQQLDDLTASLAVTETLLRGVAPHQINAPTPCPGYDVSALEDHLVAWARAFAAKSTGTPDPDVEDPSDFHASDDPAAEFHDAGVRMVRGYRSTPDGAEPSPIGIVLMETVAHGWDLAVATGQDPAFPDRAAETALDAGHAMLKPEYRGDGKSFGVEVPVPAGATAVERLVGFLGRDPGWTPEPV